MGARRIKKAEGQNRTSKRHALTIWTIAAATGFPILLASFLMTIDVRPDLSELRPAAAWPDASITLTGWPDLEPAHRKVRMLGYMMDGYTPSVNGSQLLMFILMPEAGQLLHAAHRIPNEMVEVWPRQPITFRNRNLVWVSGTLQNTGQRHEGEKALFSIRNAEVQEAQNREITHWFSQ